MKTSKYIVGFEENNTKEYIIEQLTNLNKFSNKDFDSNLLKIYSICDSNGLFYNKFISGEEEISSIEYHTSSFISKDTRIKLKRPMTLDKLVYYIINGEIDVSCVKLCDKELFNGKIKCINRSYEYKYYNVVNSTLIDAYYSRITFGKENSYLRNKYNEEKINNDIYSLSNDKKLILSIK